MRERKIAVLCDFVPDRYWTFDRDLAVFIKCSCDVFSKPLNHLHGSFARNLKRTALYVFMPLKWLRIYKQYDTVIAWQQFFGIGMAFWLRLFHIRKRADIIVMTFIYKSKKGFPGKIYRRFMDYAVSGGYISRFIVYSSSEVELYSTQLGIPKDKIIFTPYCLPEHEIPETDDRLVNMKYVFSTGRSNRDYDALFDAAAKGGFNLVVACDELENRDYGPNVQVLDSVFGDEMRKYLYNSAIVAVSLKNPDVSSGQLVFLQAMQYGKVIMCTDCSGVRDYLEDSRNAILVKTTEQWADEITRVLNDDELRLRLSETSKGDFKARFSLSNFAEKIASLI